MNNKWLWFVGGAILGYFVLPMVLVQVNGLFSKA